MRASQYSFTQALMVFLLITCGEVNADKPSIQELKTLNNQGIDQYFSGDYLKALSTFKKTLMIIKKMPNKETTDIALSYESIADTYKAIGNYSKALVYAQKALVIDEKIFGKEHFITAKDYTRVGSINQLMKNYPKALKNFQEVLAINTSLYGKEAYTTVTRSLAICDVYSAMGERSKALDCNLNAYIILDGIYRQMRPRNKRKKE